MSSKAFKPSKLSTVQQKTLVEIVVDQNGPHLTFDDFADQMLMLFEDIAGFENISDSETQSILNQLWRIYHGQT